MVDKIVETGTRWIQPHRKVTGYCRLSTSGQKDDLKTIWSQICLRFLSRSSRIRLRNVDRLAYRCRSSENARYSVLRVSEY
ncbi:hypothetical protein, partial [Faecalibaculum rodentium]|uniref:hypothetical protein n=1 Tax=Faecalibaculum rodentium TaxID=1702221 RepID=UPI003F73F2CD